MAKFVLLLTSLCVFAFQVQAQTGNCTLGFASQASLQAYFNSGTICGTAASLVIHGGAGLVGGAPNPNRINNLNELVALTEVHGDVLLDLGDLTSIDGLNNITRIGGNLTITNTTSLNGIGLTAGHDLLAGLREVGGDITIIGNPSLVLITSLGVLRSARTITFQNNPNLHLIGGSLGFNSMTRCGRVSFTALPSLTSIVGFNSLLALELPPAVPGGQRVLTDLFITGLPLLEQFNAFASLHTLNQVQINNNPRLEELGGFNNLRHVQYLSITSNTRLRSIAGFNNSLEVAGVGGSGVIISNNPVLQTIAGFRALKSEGVGITNNANLREITGFDGGWVVGSLSIVNNAALQRITGFKSLLRATNYVGITQNPRLAAVTGLRGTQAPVRLVVGDNPSLKALAPGFAYASYATLASLNVDRNDSLAACAEPWVCEYLRRGGNASITGNAASCTPAAILQACGPVSTADLVVSNGLVFGGAYRNVTVTGTGRATLSSPLVVGGTLAVQSGGVLTARHPVTGTGDFTLAAGARLVVSDTAGLSASGGEGAVQVLGTRSYSPAAEYAFAGTGPQVTGTALPAQVRRLEVNNPAGVALTQPVAVTEALTLTAGTLATAAGASLTLRSDAAGTALVVPGAGAVSGPVAVQRYLSPALNPGPGDRHLAAPVGASTVADLRTAGFAPVVNPAYNTAANPAAVTPFPTVFAYDEARLAGPGARPFDAGWASPADTAAPLVAGRGYRVHLAAPATVDFVGPLTGGTVTQALARGAGPDAGWHLVGNPYPSPLDWSAVAAADRTGLDAALYVWQGTGTATGRYRVHANGIGAAPVLALGQGFFVRATAPGVAGRLTLRDAHRLATPTALAVLRPAADPRPRLQLRLAGAGAADTAYVYFEAGATAGATPAHDAFKRPNPGNPSLATQAGDTLLAINGLPPLVATTLVPVQLAVPQAGAYTLRVAELVNFPPGTAVYLRDALLGTRTPLAVGSAHALALAGLSAPGRLTVEFQVSVVSATAAQVLAAGVQVYPNPAHQRFSLQLPAGTGTATATLLNALGQAVRTLPVTGDRAAVDTETLAAGVYTLRVQTAAATCTKRVVLK